MVNRGKGPALAAAVALVLAAGLAAGAAGTVTARPRAGLKWTEAGIPGVRTAVVEGDMAKGPSHFYLSYAAGFVAPRHHHSPDHFATTVSGTLVLVVDGQEHRLPPGSYFALRDKAPHAARCEGSEECVMFIDARGPWDVVPEKR
jgi:mannose-6-phosphate isomerase-like protein (cupin superfamily)